MLGANLGSISLGKVSVMLKWLWSSDEKCLKLKKNAKGDHKESKQARVIHFVNSVSVHMCLHSYSVSSKYLEWLWSYRAYTEFCGKMQRKITRKVSKLELCHLLFHHPSYLKYRKTHFSI